MKKILIGLVLSLLLTLGCEIITPVKNGLTQDIKSQTTLDADCKIVFEPSGTHLQHGQLKIRFDVYFGETSKTYSQQYILVVDETSEQFKAGFAGKKYEADESISIEYQKWLDSLPHIYRLNPALCVFVAIDENTTKADLENYALSTFNGVTLATLDDTLTKTNSAHLISPYMKGKLSQSSQLTTSKSNLIADTNAKFVDLEFTGNAFTSQPVIIEPKSIDVGAAVTDRGSLKRMWNGSLHTYSTCVTRTNPVNADGSLDTVNIWLYGSGTEVEWAGTFSFSGTTGTCRDSEQLGNIAAGSNIQITGLSITAVAGDYIGASCKSGQNFFDADIEASVNGGEGGVYSITGEFIDPTDSGTFTLDDNGDDELSLYATGTESGSPPTQTTIWTGQIIEW